jgi:hypothetical protein
MEDDMSLNMIDEETTAQTDDWAEAEDDEAMARFGISPNHLFGKEEAEAAKNSPSLRSGC